MIDGWELDGETQASQDRTDARSEQGRDVPGPRTQAAQQRAHERKQISLRAYRFRRALGWSLVSVGILVGVSHWLTHIQLWSFASQGVMDLAVGYPMAALLAISGTIALSR